MAREKSPQKEEDEKLRIYIAIALVLVALAVLSTILTLPIKAGSGCGQQNYACIEQKAYATSNASLCGTMPGYYSDQCYSTIAQQTKNNTMCHKVSDVNESGSCTIYIANVTNNPGLCTTLIGNLMSNCVDKLAIREQMPSICSELQGGLNFQTCLTAVYLEKAVSGVNATYCGKITSNDNTQLTFTALELSSVESRTSYLNVTQALSFAAFGNSTVGARDACYLSIAYLTSDKNYCSNVSSGLATICNVTSTHFKSELSNTSAINSTAFISMCMREESYGQCNDTISYLQAIGTRNVSSCARLSSSYHDQCYYVMSEEHNSTAYCAYIKNTTLNNDCILSVRTGYVANATSNSNGG